jgi:hypothetical protein
VLHVVEEADRDRQPELCTIAVLRPFKSQVPIEHVPVPQGVEPHPALAKIEASSIGARQEQPTELLGRFAGNVCSYSPALQFIDKH